MTKSPRTLIGPNDPAPYIIRNPEGRRRKDCILICEHGGRDVPESMDLLGLSPDLFEKHYAYDIGVRRITETLSDLLDAPAVIANYSRMIIDLNRRPDHPTSIPSQGEGMIIPGNRDLTTEEREQRIAEFFIPFHTALETMIDENLEEGHIPAIISIHSFTPTFFKQKRPWEFCILWVQDPRIPEPLMEWFARDGHTIGNNQPYDARILRGTTVNAHADARRLPSALIEIRNDLTDTDAKSDIWAEKLAQALPPVLDDPETHTLFDGEDLPFDPAYEKIYMDELIEKAKRGEI